MNGDVYKLSEKMVFGKAAWAEQMPWIVRKHSQAELKAKIQAGETLQFQRGTETVSFVPGLNRQEFTVHITGKPTPSAVRPVVPSKDSLIAAYGTERWVEVVEAYPILSGLFEAASDALALEDQFDSMSDDQAWRAITRLAESLTDLVGKAVEQMSRGKR